MLNPDFERDGIQLYCADCMDVLPHLSGVDAVISDPPFGTTNCLWDTPLNLKLLWKHYCRLCNGPVILFAQTPFDKVLGVSNLKELRYEWIWEKTHATGHLNAKKMPMKAHENILVFYKSLTTFHPQKTSGHQRKISSKKSDHGNVYGVQKIDTPLEYDSTERFPRSVLLYASDKQKECLHETQKPVALMQYMVRTYSSIGDTILDNCMGSGSAGIACLREGRRFIGIEKEPKYFDIAVKRIERALSEERSSLFPVAKEIQRELI